MDRTRPRLIPPEQPAILEIRHAVRAWLADAATRDVTVGLSGGADSLALTAAAVVEADSVHAVVVDHRLQDGSDAVARRAAAQAKAWGCVSARVVEVDVHGDGGMEAAARRARYAALDDRRDGRPVLLAHTLDDQAETVLLGLARGSGGRSLRGMAAFDPPWGRPLLAVRRSTTRAACSELAVEPHDDPHNTSAEFTRVRLRHEVLPLLDEVLGGGVAPALARTAVHLREDGEVLDADAARVASRTVTADGVDASALAQHPPAVRRRVLRSWLIGSGATGLTDRTLRAVDDLVARWHGQGSVAIGGGTPEARLVVSRRRGTLNTAFEDRGRV
ncbi:tRNA lysidine(34) synthetase TilS [Rhodococcus sp. HNM0569]|uniref:tRNA lysidine(34) synthetase TilS n=1 Tax=Rhodococcus sp. HNM0569 TaxID=2716340 RepID=UPI00146D927B|nr:tRNA lysidine(34) synthetase TilS [Rhodococcus sp. HNM0569]NLU82081.1 tRNA lysidine(34) synthetase TilS [Rhodococcus sp. HNM0569]